MRGPKPGGRVVVAAGVTITALAVLAAVTLVRFEAGPTSTARHIRGLHRQLLVVAVPLAAFVEAVLLHAVWRFRDTDDPRPTVERPRLELGWTVATGLVLLFVGVVSFQVLAHPAVSGHHAAATPGADGDAVDVTVTGQQWYWSVAYPGANVSIARADRIVLPANRTIRVAVETDDVIHSLHVPALALKQDAIPGRTTVVRTRVTERGSYHLYCAEYCGAGHAQMEVTVVVVSPDAYRDWLADRRNASARSALGGGSRDR